MKFKVMPTSPQHYARSNCQVYCKDRTDLIEPRQEPPAKPVEPKSPPVFFADPPLKQDKLITMQAEPQVEAKAITTSPKKTQPKTTEVRPKRTEADSDLVSKIDTKLQQFLAGCLSDAKKLIAKKDELKNKMGIAYLCLNDASLRGEENRAKSLRNFSLAIDIAEDELEAWIAVRQAIWVKLKDPSMIEDYLFDDLYQAVPFLTSATDETQVQKVLEERINSKYVTLISHYRKSVQDIHHFYSKYSLDLLPQSEFDVLHESIKSLYFKFKNHLERDRHRAARERKRKVS
jgi:hypothetical protein